ncbi:MAG: phosphatidylserine/phosphatidylglycerophosphate/cardiolipin synthase family protein [Polyangiaceae bacterium]
MIDQEFFGYAIADKRTTLVAHAADGMPSTYVVPGDWIPSARADALESGGHKFPIRRGNDIHYYTEGKEVFAAMAKEIDQAKKGDLVAIVGWWLEFYCWFGEGRTVHDVLVDAAKRKAQVFVLLWAGPPEIDGVDLPCRENTVMNGETCARLIEDSGGAIHATLDGTAAVDGAHHMKVVLTRVDGVMTAFYGGMDITESRLGKGDRPWHDLHARVRGPVTQDFFDVLRKRMEYVDEPVVEDFAMEAAPAQERAGSSRSRLARTLGPDESDIEPMLRGAIERARRYIYVEDQYFWSDLRHQNGIGELLARKLKDVAHVTVLVPSDEKQYEPDVTLPNRESTLRSIVRVAGEDSVKFGIYGHCWEFVHAKLWIIDDEIILTGSANCALRSYHTDTEVLATDVNRIDAEWHRPGLTHARRLRMKIWSRLLRKPPEALLDPIASAAYFRELDANNKDNGIIEPNKIRGNYWRKEMGGEMPWRYWKSIVAGL